MAIAINTFSQFLGESAAYVHAGVPRGWRVGQSVFNLLSVVRPDLAFMVSGGDPIHEVSDFDPFYEDANLPAFYDFVMRHWDDDVD